MLTFVLFVIAWIVCINGRVSTTLFCPFFRYYGFKSRLPCDCVSISEGRPTCLSFRLSFCSATLACQSVQGLSWCIISLRYHLILGKEKWFSHSDSGFLVSMYDTILHSFVFTISILSSCLNEIVDDHVLHPCICYSWRPSVVF